MEFKRKGEKTGMEKRKKWLAGDLFQMIDKILRDKNLLPQEILDYGCAGSRCEFILSEEFDVIPRVSFGGNEGIYLDIMLEAGDNTSVFSTGKGKICLGTYKTLLTDKERYKKMAVLGAEFVFELSDYVAKHMEDFNWTGYDLIIFRNGKKSRLKYWLFTHDKAVIKASRLLEKEEDISHVVIRDNKTGREETIRKAG